MSEDRINAKKALSLRKAGYKLFSVIDRQETLFLFIDDKIFVSSGNREVRLSPYSFLEIYENNLFLVDHDEEEETVDKKKDDEYYSWRQ